MNGHTLLVGRNARLTRRYLLAGLVVAVLWSTYLVSDLLVVVPVWVLAAAFVAVPAVQAFHNHGLLVSVVLPVLLALGWYLPLALFELASPRPDVLGAVGSSLLFGVPAGVLGFGLGRAAARLDAARR